MNMPQCHALASSVVSEKNHSPAVFKKDYQIIWRVHSRFARLRKYQRNVIDRRILISRHRVSNTAKWVVFPRRQIPAHIDQPGLKLGEGQHCQKRFMFLRCMPLVCCGLIPSYKPSSGGLSGWISLILQHQRDQFRDVLDSLVQPARRSSFKHVDALLGLKDTIALSAVDLDCA
jgi:hypothetical protein